MPGSRTAASGPVDPGLAGRGPVAPASLSSPLDRSLSQCSGLSARFVEQVHRAFGYHTVRHLLEHYPRRWLQRGQLGESAHAAVGTTVTVVAQVRELTRRQPRRNLRLLEVTVADGSGSLVCTWFNQDWRARQLPVGTVAAFSGELKERMGRRTLTNPEYEVLRDGDDPAEFADALTPQYAASKEVSSPQLRRAIATVLGGLATIPDPVPGVLVARRKLVGRDRAIRGIHGHGDGDERAASRSRLVYDELLVLQLGLALRRQALAAKAVSPALVTQGRLTDALFATLPYRPTAAQRRVMTEIGAELSRTSPMHRLLQGDVGSGKTLVALWALLCAVQSGYQGALMAPTEVLADQHAESLRALLAPLGEGGGLLGGPRLEVLTASVSPAARQRVLASLAAGEIDLLVSTHAVLTPDVHFARLGAVVVDEQHRFGVEQRAALRAKGQAPHMLIMTATPIPRTLALTVYGDLETSQLDELPPGRQPVATHVVATERLRERAYARVREEVALGRQAYVVCALKDESDTLEVRSAKVEAERLRAEVFPDLRVGLVYGDMAGREKQAVMSAFRAGDVDVLVATTVIEVGVDVPNATVILIEDADRFGLSQLHQLRGRVGRGGAPGLCILFADPATDEGIQRMAAISGTTDGFALAEEDLRIRGGGTLLDARQSGMSDLKLTDLLGDISWIQAAQHDARGLVESDPGLQRPEHAALREELALRLGADGAERLARG